jgi:hypothetical protein
MGASILLICDECGKSIQPVAVSTPEGYFQMMRPAGWTRLHDGFGDVTGEYFCSDECANKYLVRYNASRKKEPS